MNTRGRREYKNSTQTLPQGENKSTENEVKEEEEERGGQEKTKGAANERRNSDAAQTHKSRARSVEDSSSTILPARPEESNKTTSMRLPSFFLSFLSFLFSHNTQTDRHPYALLLPHGDAESTQTKRLTLLKPTAKPVGPREESDTNTHIQREKDREAETDRDTETTKKLEQKEGKQRKGQCKKHT